MGFRSVLILLLPLLLFSCAQVGTLSGGDKDFLAPAPVAFEPPQNTTRFSAEGVQIRFNEFIELVNPQQNIFMVPYDVQPEAHLVNKTLHVSWKGALRPNTTYSLYLNGAVRDITEGNDSLMSYVFSTGDLIDSLSYSVDLRDSWTNSPVDNFLVGLFVSSDSLRPLYFTRSDESGHAVINNIKEDKYIVRAYKDEDRDQKLSGFESRGFRSEVLALDSSVTDSIPVKVYAPVDQTPKVSSFKFFSPGMFALGSNIAELASNTFRFNGQLLASDRMISYGDSLVFFAAPDTSSTSSLIIEGSYKDTLELFLTKKEKSIPCKMVTSLPELGPKDALSITTTDLITRLDTASVVVRNDKDSSVITSRRIVVEANSIRIELDRKELKNLSVIIPEGSISTLNQSKHPIYTIPVVLKNEKELGTLVLKAMPSATPLFAELRGANGKLIRSPELSSGAAVRLEEFLSPGEYQVRLVNDLNNNGRWDPGDKEMTVQPEEVIDFNPVKIRANWEVELSLDPQGNE